MALDILKEIVLILDKIKELTKEKFLMYYIRKNSMYYVSHLVNDLRCDQEELQEFIKSTGIYYKSDFGVMKVKKKEMEL